MGKCELSLPSPPEEKGERKVPDGVLSVFPGASGSGYLVLVRLAFRVTDKTLLTHLDF